MIKMQACGHYLIVEIDDVPNESRSAGGIITALDTKREQKGMSLATVLDIGPNAWADRYSRNGENAPWCQVGDKIMIAQYAGQTFPLSDSMTSEQKERAERMRLICDDDVLARGVNNG